MNLNQNSSREEILSHIENSLFSFLYNFSHEIWAQPYIDEAAKKAAKESPLNFLHYFSDKPWAQSYLDVAAKEALKENPFGFLHCFSDKPWAQSYLDEAAEIDAKKNPKFFLETLAVRFPQYINTALFALGDKNVSK